MHGERILAGRYRLAEVIGAGGMGAVYQATDLRLDRPVAVKLLAASIAEHDRAAVARFEREARLTARLTHRGVVRIFDAGSDGGTPFIVMERVEGRGLDAVLRSEAPLHPDHAAGICRQVAAALAAAHAAGIVHRDLKPSNVMVSADGTARVLDFGVARLASGTTLTGVAAVLGTPAYMAPEQALGETADARSDIYSLGCLLYACLTGRTPFTVAGPAAIMHQHVHGDAPPPSRLNARVGPALDALVMSMLAKSPASRPQSAAAVAARLADHGADHGAAAARPRIPRAAAQSPVRAARGRRRWRRRASGVFACVLACAPGGLVLATDSSAPGKAATHRASPPRPATSSAPDAHPTSTGLGGAGGRTTVAASAVATARADDGPAPPAKRGPRDRPVARGRPERGPPGHGRGRGVARQNDGGDGNRNRG